jgi:hypothetical protein
MKMGGGGGVDGVSKKQAGRRQAFPGWAFEGVVVFGWEIDG